MVIENTESGRLRRSRPLSPWFAVSLPAFPALFAGGSGMAPAPTDSELSLESLGGA